MVSGLETIFSSTLDGGKAKIGERPKQDKEKGDDDDEKDEGEVGDEEGK